MKLDRYVPTDVGETRATLLWRRVSPRLGVKRSSSSSAPTRRWQAVALVAAIVAIALLVARRVDHRPHEPVVYDDTGALLLADGSRVHLRDEGRARLERFDPRAIEITLERGTAEIQVVHVAGRRFVVHAGAFDIVDVGTRFLVSLEGQGAGASVRVSVDEGRVEVQDPTGVLPPRVLAAGESWASSPASSAGVMAPSRPSLEVPPVPPVVPSTTAPPRETTAKQLFEAADAARAAGRTKDAAALLDRVRRHYRSDARAGLAAFQLGRLRLDSLGDPSGAVEALDDAIALAPAASFREDAEARRIEALERAGDPRCREARENYLARYPGGVHVKEVSARCGP